MTKYVLNHAPKIIKQQISLGLYEHRHKIQSYGPYREAVVVGDLKFS